MKDFFLCVAFLKDIFKMTAFNKGVLFRPVKF